MTTLDDNRRQLMLGIGLFIVIFPALLWMLSTVANWILAAIPD